MQKSLELQEIVGFGPKFNMNFVIEADYSFTSLLPSILIRKFIPVVNLGPVNLNFGSLFLFGQSYGQRLEQSHQTFGQLTSEAYFLSFMGAAASTFLEHYGGLPGFADEGLPFYKRIVNEVWTEFIQEYVDSGFESIHYREEFDLEEVTIDALKSALMAVFTVSTMEFGVQTLNVTAMVVKIGNKSIKLATSQVIELIEIYKNKGSEALNQELINMGGPLYAVNPSFQPQFDQIPTPLDVLKKSTPIELNLQMFAESQQDVVIDPISNNDQLINDTRRAIDINEQKYPGQGIQRLLNLVTFKKLNQITTESRSIMKQYLESNVDGIKAAINFIISEQIVEKVKSEQVVQQQVAEPLFEVQQLDSSPFVSELVSNIEQQQIAEPVFEGQQPDSSPVAIFVGGQPGSGKSVYVYKINIFEPKYFTVCIDNYRSYHPNYLKIEKLVKEHWINRIETNNNSPGNDIADFTHDFSCLISDLLTERAMEKDEEVKSYNLLMEWAMKEPYTPMETMKKLKELNYFIKVIFICTNKTTSFDACNLRTEILKKYGNIIRKIPEDYHDSVVESLPYSVDILYEIGYKTKLIDDLEISLRNGMKIWHNDNYSPKLIYREYLNNIELINDFSNDGKYSKVNNEIELKGKDIFIL